MYDSIIPTADTIPVHWLWFQVLLIVTFFIHMILMNFLLGGSLLTAWDLLTGKVEKKASGSIPTLVALTVNFGVPPLLFVQVLYGHLFYSSSVMLAVPWILVGLFLFAGGGIARETGLDPGFKLMQVPRGAAILTMGARRSRSTSSRCVSTTRRGRRKAPPP